MKSIQNLLLFSLLAACGAPSELEEHLGTLGLEYTTDNYTVGWDQADGWQGRYCGGWGASQACLLPPDRTVKWRLETLDQTTARNAALVSVSSALNTQVGSPWSWSGTNGSDYDIYFYNAVHGGSTTSNVMSRYIHVACVDAGAFLTEAIPGTWRTCNKHEASVDFAAIAAHCPGTALDQCLRRVFSHGVARASGVGSDSFTDTTDIRRPSSRHLSSASSPGAVLQLTDEEECGVVQLAPANSPGQFVIATDICG